MRCQTPPRQAASRGPGNLVKGGYRCRWVQPGSVGAKMTLPRAVQGRRSSEKCALRPSISSPSSADALTLHCSCYHSFPATERTQRSITSTSRAVFPFGSPLHVKGRMAGGKCQVWPGFRGKWERARGGWVRDGENARGAGTQASASRWL